MTEIVSKPDHGTLIIDRGIAGPRLELFFDDIQQKLNAFLLGPRVVFTTFAFADLPDANPPGSVFVSDSANGFVPAYSDGTTWRYYSDDGVVST